MADSTGLNKYGPVSSPMQQIPGDPNDLKGDSGGVFDGVPGYQKGSGGRIPELTFDEAGKFGVVPPTKGGQE